MAKLKMKTGTGHKPIKMLVPMHRLTEDHKGHADHLCQMVTSRRMAEVARLAKGAEYICNICGRAAAKPTSLCEPVAI